MNLFYFTERDTVLHRLDARTKLAWLAGNCALAFMVDRPLGLAGVVLFVLLQAGLARSLGNLRRVAGFLAMVSVAATFLWAVSGRGETHLVLWFKREGVIQGLAAALRIDTFVLAGMLFLSVTRSEELVQGLLRLGVPYAVCFAFAAALRLAPTFVATGWSVRESQKARGLDPDEGFPLSRLRKSIPLLVPTFLSTIRLTAHLAMSLESRGFGYGPRRTFLLESRLGWRDAVALVGLVAVLAAGRLLG